MFWLSQRVGYASIRSEDDVAIFISYKDVQTAEHRGRRNEGSFGEDLELEMFPPFKPGVVQVLLCVCFAYGQSSAFLSLLLPTDTSSDFVFIVLRAAKSLLT